MTFRSFALIIFVMLILGNFRFAYSQDTFGPICDNVTVICSPTPVPPTSAPVPTTPPRPTATRAPTPTPRILIQAGTAENLAILFGLSITFIVIGSIVGLSYKKNREY